MIILQTYMHAHMLWTDLDNLQEFQIELDGAIGRHQAREAALTVGLISWYGHARPHAHRQLRDRIVQPGDHLASAHPEAKWHTALPR